MKEPSPEELEAIEKEISELQNDSISENNESENVDEIEE